LSEHVITTTAHEISLEPALSRLGKIVHNPELMYLA